MWLPYRPLATSMVPHFRINSWVVSRSARPGETGEVAGLGDHHAFGQCRPWPPEREPERRTSNPKSDEDDCRHEERTSGHSIKRQQRRSSGSAGRSPR